MRTAKPRMGVIVGCMVLLGAIGLQAQDWPQWRGPNRDGKATGFTAPTTWPKELTQKWKVTVGDGVATPSLVGDKLYVFSRESGNEVVRCLDASNGKELWKDKYETGGATGPASGFSGPRCSPTIADGKVVTLGVRGILSCFDAAEGKLLWRKDTRGLPKFCTSSSPMVENGMCIAQIGSSDSGSVVAYELGTGNEKWKWNGSTAYASPVPLTVGDMRAVVAETEASLVAINLADGKQLWKTPFVIQGRGYNASTPAVVGDTIIYGGSSRGIRAVKLEKKDGELTGKELWSNSDNSVQYNSPIVKDGMVFGLSSGNSLFCINKEGKTAWSSALPGGDGGGRGRGGYGNIVDAGSVLFALGSSSPLVVFKPTDQKYEQVASYKVGNGGTYAYPVIAGNRIFIKDKDAVYLMTLE